MVRIPFSLSRRSLLAAIGLHGLPEPPPKDPTSDPVLAIGRRRTVLRALLDQASDEAERDRLCPELDGLAAEIADLPTQSLAAACLKLRIVAEDYDARTRDDFDGLLLQQVLDWMASTLAANPGCSLQKQARVQRDLAHDNQARSKSGDNQQ